MFKQLDLRVFRRFNLKIRLMITDCLVATAYRLIASELHQL